MCIEITMCYIVSVKNPFTNTCARLKVKKKNGAKFCVKFPTPLVVLFS